MARKMEDLTALEVGLLRVISYAGKLNGHAYWNCLCACGAMKIVIGQSLRQRKVKSCGCEQYTDREKKVKPKKRFGRLVVQSRSERREHWKCICDCGKVVEVRNSSLTSGHTQSCGCFAIEVRTQVNTTHGKSRTSEYVAMKARERLERKRAFDVAWTIEMETRLREEQPTCVVCDASTQLSVDHVRPLSKGFGLQPGNAVILCGSCNSSKHNKDLGELSPGIADKIASAAANFAKVWQSASI